MTNIKKLIMMGILTIPFLLLTEMTIAQNYSKMPIEVQAKIDQNKYDGLPIYSGVIFNYEVAVTGLDQSERQFLLDRAEKMNEIISVTFDAIGNVNVKCKSGTEFVTVKPIFQIIVSGITSIKDTYSLK